VSDSGDEPEPPSDLPDELVRQVDALELPALKALYGYVRRSVDARRPPLAALVEEDADGEVLEVDVHDGYALVRLHPPASDGSGPRESVTSLYHVRREPDPDGTESLHWTYLGDVKNGGAE